MDREKCLLLACDLEILSLWIYRIWQDDLCKGVLGKYRYPLGGNFVPVFIMDRYSGNIDFYVELSYIENDVDIVGYLEDRYGLDRSRIEVVYNGIDEKLKGDIYNNGQNREYIKKIVVYRDIDIRSLFGYISTVIGSVDRDSIIDRVLTRDFNYGTGNWLWLSLLYKLNTRGMVFSYEIENNVLYFYGKFREDLCKIRQVIDRYMIIQDAIKDRIVNKDIDYKGYDYVLRISDIDKRKVMGLLHIGCEEMFKEKELDF